jgi:hypothetical protein
MQICTAQQLAEADRQAIRAAMRRLRPAPTLEVITTWQDHARKLSGVHRQRPVRSGKARTAGWEQVAAFVVSFETRRTGADPDRRLVVEQVEQAPPEPRQEWPGWSTEAAWTWMLERATPKSGTDVQAATVQPAPAGPRSKRRQTRQAPVGSSSPGRVPQAIEPEAPELALADGTVRRLDDSLGTVDVPPRASLRVSATCEPGMQLHVALRLRRDGAPSYAAVPPVTVISGEPAQFDLQDLPPGDHAAVLTLWADRGAAAAAIVRLPRLHVHGP